MPLRGEIGQVHDTVVLDTILPAAHIPAIETSSPFQSQRVVSVKEAKAEAAHLSTDSVVKIYTTDTRPNYLHPWQVLGQHRYTGTGFVLSGRRIITNAHVVECASVLQVQKQECPQKFRARVECIAHDLDLAVVSVSDEAFWKDLSPAILADKLPDLYSEVKCVGFPSGGSTLCVTKGVLSRVDAQLYVHPRLCGVLPGTVNSPGNVLILQIDAAINPGSSGGPTFGHDGTVVGIASSGLPGMQNVGYIIPAPIAGMFLEEFAQTGRWSGLSELGISYTSLEHETMREFLRMGEETGVLVTDVAPLGALHASMRRGDVLTHLDGYSVSFEGKVPFEVGGQKVFVDMDAVVTQKPKAEVTRIKFLRDGKSEDIEATLAPIPALAPRFHGFDCTPEYLLVGGLVFTRVTVPLRMQYLAAQKTKTYSGPSLGMVWDPGFMAYKETEEHDAVMLLRILQHDINIGCPGLARILATLNEREIRSLPALAREVAAALQSTERFVRFKFKREDSEGDSGLPDIVLERSQVAAANAEICETHRIPSVVSSGLQQHFTAASEEDKDAVGVDALGPGASS